MSKETHEWLSNNTLIGFTDKRGNAWHYREGDDNHFPGAIPVETVRARLFDWHAVERDLYVPTIVTEDLLSVVDGEPVVSAQDTITGYTAVPNQKAIVRSDSGLVMGIFKGGYQPHQYDEWLLGTVSTILDDDLSIGSAGLLQAGAVAWVSVEVPDTITTPEGVEFRPHLLATTSFNGKVATTFKRIVTAVVCDNTLDYARGESGPQFKVKHSRNSAMKLQNARDALQIVHSIQDDFAATVAELTAVKVSDHAWENILNTIVPLPKEGDASTREINFAEKKRGELWSLWTTDDRVAPWKGTAFGAWQAFNTHMHHKQIVRGAERAERNQLNAVLGKTGEADADVVEKILALAA